MPKGRGRFQPFHKLRHQGKENFHLKGELGYSVKRQKLSESASQSIANLSVTDGNNPVHNSIFVFADLPLVFPKFSCTSSLTT